MNNNFPEQSRVYRWLVIAGGVALMAAMCVDVVAVIGRTIRMPLLGSIEIVQYVVGISGATGLVIATLNRRHATVMILYSHLKGHARFVVGMLNGLCCALFFLALFAGSVWILTDLWSAYEESEFWRLPYRPLRLYISAVTLAVVVLFLRLAWSERKP
jgi:TRAP-type transport system small permease protein